MKNLANSQKKILDIIINWIGKHGYPPTLRELCKTSKLESTWTIRYHLKKLQDSGFIKLKEGVSRGIILLKHTPGIPIIGYISAGKPIEAIENIEGYVDFSNMFGNSKNIFALRIKGDSMTGAGIHEDDLVFVKKQTTFMNKDIVVSFIDDEALVKRLLYKKKSIQLISENPNYPPIEVNNTKQFTIIGKVVGVLRKYTR